MPHPFLASLLAIAVNVNSATETADIRQVAWLAGCWEMVSEGKVVEEQWLAPRGKSMVGVSRTVRGDSLAGYELMIIREQDGRLAYEAHPSGQPSAVFLSITLSDTLVLFENPQHDFPQRVGYRLIRPDSLSAWIEGRLDGRERRVEFPYQRARGGEAG